MILYFNAMLVLLVGLFASHKAYAREPAKWFLISSVGGSLWVAAYALIELAQTQQTSLMAGRMAFLGPMIGAPALYYLVRTIAFETRPRALEYLTLFAVSAAFHIPALATDLVLEGVTIDLFGNKTWEYGSLAFLPGTFWLATIAMVVIGATRERDRISWPRVNRVLWISSALFAWLAVGVFTNVFMLMIVQDPRFYYVGPASIFLPFSIIGWSVRWEVLPDLLGMVGKVFPNARQRFLVRLDEFEQNISAFGSTDAALNRLSSILGGRVSMAFGGMAPGKEDVAGKLWGDASAWEKLYSPADRERWQRLAQLIVKMDERPEPTRAGSQHVTGWPKTSQFEKPRDALWPLASMASWRISSLVSQRVAEEPVVVLAARSEFTFVRAGVVRIAARNRVEDVTYPDAADDGESLGKGLAKRIAAPRDTLLVVTIESYECAPAFEQYVKDLIDRGLKVIALVNLETERLEDCHAFSSEWFAQFDIPVIDLFPVDEYAEDLSAMIDVLLLEFEDGYGARLRLSPEERESLVSTMAGTKSTALVPLLERLVITKMTGKFAPQSV